MIETYNSNATRKTAADLKILVVIPCLNEELHLHSVLSFVLDETVGLDADIIVVDGGSTDGSRTIVSSFAALDPRVHFLINPRRIQSSAINLAVATHSAEKDFLIRVDAHCGYPSGFIRGIIDAALENDACSVVVPMETIGRSLFQRAAAAAQNSKLGNGGSQHRNSVSSQYVDHGHHALMSIATFRSVGGYDETFSHNEDAELDVRIRQAGGKIWLEGAQTIEYYPRKSPGKLFRQYYNYGKGRARNTLKHATIPKLRQAIPIGVAPAVFLAFFSPMWWPLALPAAAWLSICLGYGVRQVVATGKASDLLIGLAITIMHFGWSAGLILGLIQYAFATRPVDPSPSLHLVPQRTSRPE